MSGNLLRLEASLNSFHTKNVLDWMLENKILSSEKYAINNDKL